MGRTYRSRASGNALGWIKACSKKYNYKWQERWKGLTCNKDEANSHPVWCRNMLIISTLAYWVSSSSCWLSNKKRRRGTTSGQFAVLISKSQMGTCGEKHWWWTFNIRGLLVNISCQGVWDGKKFTTFSQCEISHKKILWLVIWSSQHRKAVKAKQRRARLKYVGS